MLRAAPTNMRISVVVVAVILAPLSAQHAPLPRGAYLIDNAKSPTSNGSPGPNNVGNNLRMNRDSAGHLQAEPYIAVSPLDPDRVIGTAVDTRSGNGHAAFYTSIDGGRTTTVDGVFPLQPGMTGGGDPSIGFDGFGRAYIVEIQLAGSAGALFVYRSDDGGLTWPVTNQVFRAAGNAPDKPFLAVDPRTTGTYAGSLYVTFTGFNAAPFDLRMVHSRDAGATWSSPIYLGTGQGTSPAVGPNGEVYVSWDDYAGHIVCSMSPNGGGSRRGARVVANILQNPNPLPPTSFRCFSFPTTAVDVSHSPYRGRVYVSWSSRAGSSSEVFCATSVDNGLTWSPPVRINDAVTNDQFFQGLAVDETGTVFASWYDRRDDPANRTYHVYASASYDGGATWTPNWKVSSAPSDPGTSGWIGDYSGLCARGGRCFPIWTDLHTGDYDAYTAAVQADLEVTPPLAIQASTGGTIDLPIKAGPLHAGESYVLVAGLSGTSPGVAFGGGFTLHLNPDTLTQMSLSAGNGTIFVNTIGVVSAGGLPTTQPRIVLPPGLLSPLAFQRLSFTYVLLDASPQLSFASNPVTLWILP